MKEQHEPQLKKLSRRDFVKVGLASGIALVVAGLPGIDEVEAGGGGYTGSYKFGTDSSTRASVNGVNMPQNFYIPRTGYGLWYDSQYFITGAATDCPSKYYVHSYWLLYGPNNVNKGSRSNYQWGYDQGTQAASAWYNHDLAPYFYGKTFFGDIEPIYQNGNRWDGWDDSSKTPNRDVLRGYLDAIVAYNSTFVPGIYISATYWGQWFGTGYSTTRSAALWIAACGANTISCAPNSSSCSTTQQQAATQFNTKKGTIFGKNKTVIWQYWIGSGKDFDISVQSGNGTFNPIRVTTPIYTASAC